MNNKYDHRKTPCFSCGKPLDCGISPEEEGPPKPGNLTVCAYCGAVGIFDSKMVRRPLTDNEMLNPDIQEALQRAKAFWNIFNN